jgi:hypothetical protein
MQYPSGQLYTHSSWPGKTSQVELQVCQLRAIPPRIFFLSAELSWFMLFSFKSVAFINCRFYYLAIRRQVQTPDAAIVFAVIKTSVEVGMYFAGRTAGMPVAAADDTTADGVLLPGIEVQYPELFLHFLFHTLCIKVDERMGSAITGCYRQPNEKHSAKIPLSQPHSQLARQAS